MKTLRVLGVVLSVGWLSGCGRIVTPGHVGIVVNNFGSQKGVQDLPTQVGWVWYNPFTEDVYVFPTYLQNVVWTQASHEGSPNDDSITFNSSEGASVNCDIAISYSFVPDKVPHIFMEFRQDAEHITSVYVRSRVRDWFSVNASKMRIADLFGAGKQGLLDSVKSALNKELGPKGLQFDQVSVVGKMRTDPKIEEAISAVIASANRAVEAENNLKRARLDAQAQELQRTSLSTLVLRKMQLELAQKALEKWNGAFPQVMAGGELPFLLNINTKENGQ
jgi:regulator of protease activity HflC (stomatin/prohibitin superfamily)